MTEILFTGLDGKNPLGFLAALGVLNVVTDHAKRGRIPRLKWKTSGTYRPILVDGPDRDSVLDLLEADRDELATEAALDLRYQKSSGAEAHDLKSPPARFVDYLQTLVETEARRSLSFAAAFATDVAVDNNGNTKPTALHFTAGQQEFLAMVSELRKGVVRADFEEALFGPWRYARPLPILQWDNSQARDYALRASDPSKDKKLGVPGADWLAFRGLPFVRVAPVGGEVLTTGCRGGWKTGAFRWPIWSAAIERAVVHCLLTSPELFAVERSALSKRGIAIVFESSIGRSDQGGYGSFSPASVARPARP